MSESWAGQSPAIQSRVDRIHGSVEAVRFCMVGQRNLHEPILMPMLGMALDECLHTVSCNVDYIKKCSGHDCISAGRQQ